MENKEIIEGNKLIAEFMGKTVYPEKIPAKNKQGFIYSYKWKGERKDYSPFELKYNTSWDWLMPVVENIQSLAIDEVGEINVMIASHECLIGEDYYHPIINIERNGSYISMIYIAVVEFIKWYNENKNN